MIGWNNSQISFLNLLQGRLDEFNPCSNRVSNCMVALSEHYSDLYLKMGIYWLEIESLWFN